MKFRVVPPSRSEPQKDEPGFVLMQDRWDDYGFRTQYHLYLISTDSVVRVGAVKILKRWKTAYSARCRPPDSAACRPPIPRHAGPLC